jgi:hypothetical protein
VNLIKDCLLYSLFGVKVYHTSGTIFDLYRLYTLTTDVLPKSIIKPAPESFVLFSLNDGKDIPFCSFVLSVLRCF